MMKSSVTISMVDEARSGPFVFHGEWEAACQSASRLGYHAVELFASSGSAIREGKIRDALERYNLQLSAVGTGAGWVLNKWHLCHSDRSIRQKSLAFIKDVIDAGSEYGAPAILGSMQGRWEMDTSREEALECLAEALIQLGDHACRAGTRFLYEPLNRYETNLINRMDDAVHCLDKMSVGNVFILADLFHMNIEESSISDALVTAGPRIGHIHFVDSNRRAAGMGHMEFLPVLETLNKIGYGGYLSAEAFPWPDSVSAAAKTMETLRKFEF